MRFYIRSKEESTMITFVGKRILKSYPSISGFTDRKGKSTAKDAAGQGNKGGD